MGLRKKFAPILLSAASLAVFAAGQRKPAPDLRQLDSRGSLVELSAYKGKVVLLNFWATTCGGCKLEIPWFVDFDTRYRSRGLVVIGVSMDEGGWKAVKPFIRDKRIEYPIVLGDDALVKRYGVEALPVTVLIDREGKIASSRTGIVDRNQCEKEIEALLH